MRSLKYKSYNFSHRLISFLRDKDIRGIRRLSVVLPKLLLPNPDRIGEHVMQTIHGFALKIDPSIDKGVELSIFETGTYEKGLLHFLKNFLKQGDCFIDVGANIGLISIYASKRVGQTGKILSYEAHPDTYRWLNFNTTLNKIKNIESFNFALGSETGEAKIYDNWQVNRGGASLVVKNENSKSYAIQVKRLDDCLPENSKPKAIKIDVEGFELEVLKGAKQTVEIYKPILIIKVSCLRKNQHENNDLIDFIEQLGFYQLYKLSGTKERVSKLIKINSRLELPEHDNIICLPEN